MQKVPLRITSANENFALLHTTDIYNFVMTHDLIARGIPETLLPTPFGTYKQYHESPEVLELRPRLAEGPVTI